MSNSLFGEEDPWENGWATDYNQRDRDITIGGGFGIGSSLLGASQLADPEPKREDFLLKILDAPSSFHEIYSKVGGTEALPEATKQLIDSLERANVFTDFQASRIFDEIGEHKLGDTKDENEFYKVLGLISLELQEPGSGNYRTLQFRAQDLPEFPPSVLKTMLSGDEVLDPLSAGLAATSLQGDDDNWNKPGKEIPGLIESLPNLLASAEGTPKKLGSKPEELDELQVMNYTNDIKNRFSPLIKSDDAIKIKEIPEKEGVLFKHINYVITHELSTGMYAPSGAKKVIRRYSDFVWLLEILLKKYPFRIIPGLPPKKFSGSSPDSQFLQRRRRGLHRFLNQLAKHPVLRTEPIVITFLNVPTDINTWKRQAKIDYSLEFKGQKIKPEFINVIWPAVGADFMSKWTACENDLPKLIQFWTRAVILVERYEKRQQQIAFDNERFVEVINRIVSLDNSIYPHKDDDSSLIARSNKDDMTQINDALKGITDYLNKSSQELIDESFDVNTSVLEKFKNYLDYLYSFQELMERFKRLLVNTIPSVQKRLQENEARFNKINSEDADIKGSELAKLKQTILTDKQDIFQQLNKDWLIKSCIFEEFLIFQETQYLISEMWIDWCKGRNRFKSNLSALSDNLSNEVMNGMPLSR